MGKSVLWVVCLASCCMLAVPNRARAENWPQFRGPTGQGVAADPNPPLHWSATEHVAWKADVPGAGWSSPVVWGDRVFLTTATDGGTSCRVLCFGRADGKALWDVEVFKQKLTRKEGKNSWATPTPVADGERVYASFAGGAAAVTFDGKVAWTNTDFPYYSRHGLGASPVLYKDSLILPSDGSEHASGAEEYVGWQRPWEKGFVLALDKATGKVKWKAMRGLPTRISHVTPLVIDVDGRKQLVSPAGDYVMAFDPDTGERLWWVRSEGETPVPSVVYGGGLLFTTSGWTTNTTTNAQLSIRAIRPGGKGERGDLTASHIVWTDTKGVPTMPSFLYVDKPAGGGDGVLFGVKEDGVLYCRDPKNGDILWQQRLEGKYSASPVLAAGRVYLLNEAGRTTVIEAGREFKVMAENPVGGEACQASPAFSDGQVFIRSDKHLFCIGEKGARQP